MKVHVINLDLFHHNTGREPLRNQVSGNQPEFHYEPHPDRMMNEYFGEAVARARGGSVVSDALHGRAGCKSTAT